MASASFSIGLKVGWNQRWAISVGTTALLITAVTRMVYFSWSMMWLVRPNSAEIVPKVSPVDIRSVVYIPSLGSKRKVLVSGRMPTNFVAILIARNTTISPAAAATAWKF